MFNSSSQVQINLLEVDNAEPLAGQVFKRSFNELIPNFPKHFVLLANNDKDQALTLGYVHFTQHENMYLGGGMCVNNRALRHLPQTVRREFSEHGGVAFYMLSESVKKLKGCDAVFGYVGHKGAYKIDLAVGFEQTEYKHLIVYWKTDVNKEKQQQIIQSAYQFGPF